MFPFGRNPYSSPFNAYHPYEDLLLQQELQRRRQAEEYHRRRQLEELNRRRVEQLEYARRQAELQRHREAEARRRHQQELETRRRKLSEPAHQRPSRLRIQEPSEGNQDNGSRRQSMFDGGAQNLFDMLYGAGDRPDTPTWSGKRSKSSDPRGTHRINPVWSETKDPEDSMDDQPSATEESAVSDTEEPGGHDVPSQPDSSDLQAVSSQSTIADVLKSFSGLKSGFVFPSKLDFLTAPGDMTVAAPKLAYTPNNAPLHQYEHLLTGLLTKLDAIESYGQESIRKARKDAVKQIELELEELDVKKLQEWRRQSETAMPASVPMAVDTEAPSHPSKLSGEPSEPTKPSEVLMNMPNPDPASIPLPRDEDLRIHSDTGSLSFVASSELLATPPAHSSDLPPTVGNSELDRSKTPMPADITSDSSLGSVVENSAADVSKESEIEAADGRVVSGSANSDKGNNEAVHH